jgi:arrestin-related trafficking adapter 4/5/7
MQTVANIWPNKIEYSISTPSKAVIYGTSVQVEFRLVSLLKGLKIGTITTQVVETQEFSLNPEAVATFLNHHKYTRVVADDEYTVPQDPDILDEEAEGYKFSRHLELPKSLTKCLQDAETRGIKIRHKLKFNVLLHNPDEHTSELRATLPVSLYISPSLAINDNNELVDQSPVAARRAVENDLSHASPPLYGDHQLDQMYSDVDISGYHTPGNVSTPHTLFGSRSRNLSTENISALDTIPLGSFVNGVNGVLSTGDMSAAALRHRLQNLRSGPSPPATETLPNHPDFAADASRLTPAGNGGSLADYFNSEPHSRSSFNQSRSGTPGQDRSSIISEENVSRRTSDEDSSHILPGAQTPGPQYHEVEYLSRVPSYSTAVRASARTLYSSSDLPTYGAATSGRASPSSSRNIGSGAIEALQLGHMRGQIAGPGAGTLWRGGSSALSSARESQLRGRRGSLLGSMHGRSAGEIQDEERRQRLMQLRGRT